MLPSESANPRPLMLAIETSQREASVALRDRAGVVHEEPLSPRKRHDDDLLPAIDRLFKRVGLTPKDLRGGAVAVSIGPGGFTGLRIATATAKMFAETLGAGLIAVPSAIVAAESSLLAPGSAGGSSAINVLVALACKGESFWATRVLRDDASVVWLIVGEPGIAQTASFELGGAHAIIADEFFPDAARGRAHAAGVAIVPLTLTARSVLSIGERMLARGETADPLRLLPLYPRQPEAVTLWESRAS